MAPREISDLTYRASRVAGLVPGAADRVAHAVTAAAIVEAGAVGEFVGFARSGHLEALHRRLVATEAEALGIVLDGRSGEGWDRDVEDAAGRAFAESVIVQVHRDAAGLADPTDRGVQLQAGVADAARVGLRVPRADFAALADVAAAFLVEEAVLDAIEPATD